jgi:hypothetical protein
MSAALNTACSLTEGNPIANGDYYTIDNAMGTDETLPALPQ